MQTPEETSWPQTTMSEGFVTEIAACTLDPVSHPTVIIRQMAEVMLSHGHTRCIDMDHALPSTRDTELAKAFHKILHSVMDNNFIGAKKNFTRVIAYVVLKNNIKPVEIGSRGSGKKDGYDMCDILNHLYFHVASDCTQAYNHQLARKFLLENMIDHQETKEQHA